MVLMRIVCLLGVLIGRVGAITEMMVESPFYVRARVHDSQTATVIFEIAQENDQRECQMYKFTIRRNREYPYSMPEQNLTFWRNSLDLKHLDVGDYRICAIICSENLRSMNFSQEQLNKKNRSIPISACVTIHAYRSHFLVLTLYILVVIILTFSQIIFTLRKRKFQARIKSALIEVETTLQKWRTAQTPSASTDNIASFCTLQSLVNLPSAPVEHAKSSSLHPNMTEHRTSHPIIFHIETSITEIP